MFYSTSAANCVLEDPFDEVFNVTPYFLNYALAGGATCNVYLVTCTRTKGYRYVGLTKTAAIAAKAAKSEKYNRRNPAYDFSAAITLDTAGRVVPSSVAGPIESQADVQFSRDGGDMCSISVRVSETITCYVTDAVTPLGSMDATWLRAAVAYAVGETRDYDNADC